MSRRITFKLYDKSAAGNPLDELALSLAFQRHCHVNLGMNVDLNVLVKRVWLKFLQDSVDKPASNPEDLVQVGVAEQEVAGEVPQGDTPGNGDTTAGLAESPSSDAVAEPEAVDDPTATPAG